MSWIETISYQDADTNLRKLYDRIIGPNGQIDQVLSIHSLRPHTLMGHMALYKSVLHHGSNSLPKWYLECVGTYVSRLNTCDYCVAHHSVGLQKCLQDEQKSALILKAINENNICDVFTLKEAEGLKYARNLTEKIKSIQESDIKILAGVGFTDGEILELNQVTSYFNYVNRTVLGLGVNTSDEVLGYSPGDDSNAKNWTHS